ncbi:hypothetical protein DERF_005442 [Dermatophagoides farinae]|uniref:Uncharacterized protein n=1 Tax=Dermatophagoides farinae TaxID=6954 RepID=A0A922LB94_DERFA|nr:hypothetical protein DERF_005442 [Dermatophagoides farinae]
MNLLIQKNNLVHLTLNFFSNVVCIMLTISCFTSFGTRSLALGVIRSTNASTVMLSTPISDNNSRQQIVTLCCQSHAFNLSLRICTKRSRSPDSTR